MQPVDYLHPPAHAVEEAVARAIAEDLTPLGDLTAALLPPVEAEAHFVARAPGVLAGTRCATEAFRRIDPTVEVAWLLDEGDPLATGSAFGVVRGPLASIVTAERTALNFLGHLSGIATLTRAFVDEAARGGGARVWDTRKTIPGLRSLAKAAVRAGGGRNHRGNLSDWLLIKDNHLGGTSITEAVAVARDRWPGRTVHVECDTLEQCVEALEAGADAVLLDNMTPEEAQACVAAAEVRQGGLPRRTLLECSGGITLDTVAAYSAAGVDMVSVGAITNSAPVLDIGLDLA
ncbi:MAG: carboxylating nicotinate-nucleotide diphosphorylase [Microthrixaceae bacterium]